MDEAANASLQDIAATYQHRLDELRQMQRDVSALTATARTRDGSVSVEVGAHGQLRGIRLHPKAYKRMNPQRLAHTIMGLVGEATEKAAEQATELTAEFLPEEMADRLRDGGTDIAEFLPNAPSIADTGQD